MKYCKKCLQPDTRPGIVFDEEGVCYACLKQEERNKTNWYEREADLKEIAAWAKAFNGPYDCAIGVSGGKDSTFQALYCRDKLGLNCLLVSCEPDGMSEVGKHNMENLIQQGFDVIKLRPNPIIERYLSRKSFFKYGNFVKPLEYPLYASTFRVALEKGIKLVVQGENDADVFGVDKLPSGPDAMNWAMVDTVGGGDPSIFVDDFVSKKDLNFYEFPNVEKMVRSGMKAIFLAYYAKEWSHFGNTNFAILHGLKGRPDHDPSKTGKFNKYSSLDADLKVVNQMLKYYKFGFGACSDEVNYAIREGRMTREQGISILKKYDGKCSEEYIFKFCEYLDISLHDFWEKFESIVNRKLFCKIKREWYPMFKVGA